MAETVKTLSHPAWNKGKKESVKHVYYTDGKTSIRIPETETPPEGFVRGRLKASLTEEQRASFNEKRRKTNLERHGDAEYNNMQKQRQTCMERFGVENAQQCLQVQQKTKETNLRRYGTANPAQSEEVKRKIVEVFQQKYGVDNISQLPRHRKLMQAAWAAKTEEELQDIRERREKTCQERYGVSSYMQQEGIQTPIHGRDSGPNNAFAKLLQENNITYSREIFLEGFRFDFLVNNTLIEIDPTITHNTTWSPFGSPVDKEYHRRKSDIAERNGMRCIHLWDWDNAYAIVELLKTRQKVYARNCDVVELDKETTQDFLNKYHLQGFCKYQFSLGLVYKEKVISVMTFGKPRYSSSAEYELLRYASSYSVIGGAEKLFTHFQRITGCSSIVSYCDRSKFSGKTYEKLGFKLKYTTIGRHWYNEKTNQHITDNLLRQLGFDKIFKTSYGKGTDNVELMFENGFLDVYDCGQSTYMWNKNK